MSAEKPNGNGDVPASPTSPSRRASKPSNAILAGADSLVALLNSEVQRALHPVQAQLRDLESKFQSYRVVAEGERLRMATHIDQLEAEIASLKAALATRPNQGPRPDGAQPASHSTSTTLR